MRTRSIIALVGALTVSFAVAANNTAPPFVSPIFGDNMVLQRGKPNRIWGWSIPGSEVRIQFAGHSAAGVVGPDGRWQVELEPPPAGGPYTMAIDGAQHVEFREILVGDVWLCGGQSNMELGLGQVRNAAQELKSAEHPEIRLFIVSHQVSYSPALVPQGSWKICSPHTVADGGWGGFSAVAYFFGRRLQRDVNVPIGLIEDCVGGTPVESWMSPAAVARFQEFEATLKEIERLRANTNAPQHGSFLMHWLDEYDPGGVTNAWAKSDWNDSDWKHVSLPTAFKELEVLDVPCVCWFRKEITLPDPLPAGPATLYLGAVEKMDTTYLNGFWVGASSWAENPRVYRLNAGVLKPGHNVVAVRVFKLKPGEGFMSEPDVLRLELGDKTVVPLAKSRTVEPEWKGKVSVDARPPHSLPLSFENYPTMPAVLNEGMIAPVAPFALSGAIWYQGEANAERAGQYRKLLPAMITDWRDLFHQGDFPFYIASLPAFMRHQEQPGESSWAELREAQAWTARNVRNCGLAVTIDTGEPDDIHPKDKVPVGERLALCALAGHYGRRIPSAGPTFKSVETLPGALKIHFDHADGGLVVRGSKLEEFSVAGAAHRWFWAEAKIEGDTVVVSSPEVPEPRAVRYAWQSNPKATLFNGAGLPAGPFRSDSPLEPLETSKRE